jgi:hypothetical protein
MFSSANDQLNRKNQRAKDASAMKAAEDKARTDIHAEAARMEAEIPAQQEAIAAKEEVPAQQEAKEEMPAQQEDAKVEEAEATNATENATVIAPEIQNATFEIQNGTENLTAATPVPEAAPAAPTKKPTPVAQPELAPPDADQIAEAKVQEEETKFPTDWIKNDVKYNVDKPTTTREDSVAEAVKKQTTWKTSTEGWFLQTKQNSFTLRPWGTPA